MKSPRVSLPVLAMVACAGGMLVQLATPYSVLRGDVSLFGEFADRILAGDLPYVDFPFEHLPLSAVPMVLVDILERLLPGIDYEGAFAVATAIGIVTLAVVVQQLGMVMNLPNAGRRWVAIVTPMLPFLLYRLDVWSTIAFAMAMLMLARRRQALYLAMALVGIGIKAWPVLLAGRDYIRKEWRHAITLTVAAVGLFLLLLRSPGFTSGRSFEGVHLETLSGSLTLMARLLTGADHGIESAAGALYIGVGDWAMVLNVMCGIAVGIVGLVKMRRSDRGDAWLLSVAVLGVLLASPLLSAQFLLWVTPLVALIERPSAHGLIAGAGAISTVLLIWWNPIALGWSALLILRNIFLVGAAASILLMPAPVPSSHGLRRPNREAAL